MKDFGHIKGTRKEIIPNLWLGDFIDAEEIGEDSDWKIFAILDYPANECPCEPKSSMVCSIFRNREQKFGESWTESKDLCVNIDILNELASLIDNELADGKKVLVHCVGGVHRSPLVVAWFLYRLGHVPDIDAAYDLIISKRPEVERRAFWLPNFDEPKAEDFE